MIPLMQRFSQCRNFCRNLAREKARNSALTHRADWFSILLLSTRKDGG